MPPVSETETARYARERAFHDGRYANDDRAANRFYEIDASSIAHYLARLDTFAPDGRVLEYGCGDGADTAVHLARAGARPHAVDLSAVAIEHARERATALGLADRIEFAVMNAEALDFEDDSFDAVCGTGVLHHLDLDRACREIARVLRPGGTALFVEPLGHNPLINLYRRCTPDQRTPDEHPLLMADMALVGRHFERLDTTFFSLTPLLTLPLARARGSRRLLDRLERVDRVLFQRVPRLRRLAWIVVLELQGPRSALASSSIGGATGGPSGASGSSRRT